MSTVTLTRRVQPGWALGLPSMTSGSKLTVGSCASSGVRCGKSACSASSAARRTVGRGYRPADVQGERPAWLSASTVMALPLASRQGWAKVERSEDKGDHRLICPDGPPGDVCKPPARAVGGMRQRRDRPDWRQIKVLLMDEPFRCAGRDDPRPCSTTRLGRSGGPAGAAILESPWQRPARPSGWDDRVVLLSPLPARSAWCPMNLPRPLSAQRPTQILHCRITARPTAFLQSGPPCPALDATAAHPPSSPTPGRPCRRTQGLGDALDTAVATTSWRARLWPGPQPKLTAVGLFLAFWRLVVTQLGSRNASCPSRAAPSASSPASGPRAPSGATAITVRVASSDSPSRRSSASPRCRDVPLAAVARAQESGALITGLQTMPSIAWFPLAILLFQLSEEGDSRFVILIGAVPSIANGVISGVDYVPPLLIRAGRNLARQRSRPLSASSSQPPCRASSRV